MILDELTMKPDETTTERTQETGTDGPESPKEKADHETIWDRFDLGGEG